ncbi:MAG: DEAD/DEAH box helicase family protein [Nitrososphaerota archaeon]
MNELIEWVDQCFKRSSLDIILYRRQKDALYKLLEVFFNQKRIKGVFQMPTGAGKTVVAAGLIAILYRSRFLREKDIILYLTPRIILRDQVEEKFEQFFKIFKEKLPTFGEREVFEIKNLEEDVVNLLNNYLNVRQANEISILIVTPNGLHNFLKQYKSVDELNNASRIKLILLDEVHRVYFGPEILKSINMLINGIALKNASIIGLSATPIRQAIEYIGPILYSLSSLQAMEERILVGKLKIYSTNTKTKLIQMLDKDEWDVAVIERAEKYSDEILRILSRELEDFYTRDMNPLLKRIPKTLIVAANTTEANEIAENLRKRISELGLSNADELVRVAHYKVSKAEKEIDEFKKQDQGILVTVNMADIGFDDKDLEVLVIARPIRTHIAYVQIRGRVLRQPKSTKDNIKASKYAILIDFTGAAQHEKFVMDVELGKFAVENFEELESDLKGKDKVDRVRGEVTVDPNYQILIIPEKPKPPMPIVIEEILKLLIRLPYGLTVHDIQSELSKRGFDVNIDEVERICKKLTKTGKLVRYNDKLFYPYEARIIDIIQASKDKVWSINELMQEARIPKEDEQLIEKILRNIVREVLTRQPEREWKLSELSNEVRIREGELLSLIPKDLLDRIESRIVIVSRQLRRVVTLKNLREAMQNMTMDVTPWICVLYPLWLEESVEECIMDIEKSTCYFVSDKEKNETIGRIFLKRWIAIVNTPDTEIKCNDLDELLTKLISLRHYTKIVVKYPIKKTHVLSPKIFYIATKLLKFKILYAFDDKSNMEIITLIKDIEKERSL